MPCNFNKAMSKREFYQLNGDAIIQCSDTNIAHSRT